MEESYGYEDSFEPSYQGYDNYAVPTSSHVRYSSGNHFPEEFEETPYRESSTSSYGKYYSLKK